MNQESLFTFEEIFKQNERRIYYHINKLRIGDQHQEYYQEGLYARWNANRTYQQDNGILSTYFNYIVKKRFTEPARKNTKVQRYERMLKHDMVALYTKEGRIDDPFLWDMLRSELTENQWNYLDSHIRLKMTVEEIAEREKVTVDTVKYWERQVKERLGNEVFRDLVTVEEAL
ncbi:hypothetical protein CIL05_18325 [Virgibacillus profundi]|uniref:RNA polymerase sigma-70 region 2 domain-containing protein n=1 Tax=Virgibacillus profundi TaxID=2024555 RepID=A0A2A2I8W2_9BACI|nr:hypothetical protein [Virgibacillus profundi]PAV28067.1 hypothetical protein CIL05_18325 [Virgibacillus profundi]PXY52371.1 sigma-70 family RNA polymerase sigma factor [Virgibacillus profundi]